MALDGAAFRLVRTALNAFCEYHDLPLLDDTATEAAEQLIKMVIRGESDIELLLRHIEDWFISR
ncbi:hypothetical protein N7E02_02035 (plasmid) [Aliirhizobium terrae]|uniref:hypothetical protein n=1 Tax=Terrirhizobium terrae TaxID=2926709 RepID=UPI00257723EE|nr:hypothetical protein [Rhizobium sp. CC-CFT758]WJH37636.1 hypothetical protein N7E02_02035 [Rhizobium sp. CC-CFT758]